MAFVSVASKPVNLEPNSQLAMHFLSKTNAEFQYGLEALVNIMEAGDIVLAVSGL